MERRTFLKGALVAPAAAWAPVGRETVAQDCL
ncbi:twin-arginine translocation signal domain-containing protein [Rhizobium leguminosarum]|nr:twin-arginine translocation signal domain-containing protein [Rhizobium leguminosarum]